MGLRPRRAESTTVHDTHADPERRQRIPGRMKEVGGEERGWRGTYDVEQLQDINEPEGGTSKRQFRPIFNLLY